MHIWRRLEIELLDVSHHRVAGLAVKDAGFRRVLCRANYSQLVVMALRPKEGVGAEVHKLEQFLRAE